MHDDKSNHNHNHSDTDSLAMDGGVDAITVADSEGGLTPPVFGELVATRANRLHEAATAREEQIDNPHLLEFSLFTQVSAKDRARFISSALHDEPLPDVPDGVSSDEHWPVIYEHLVDREQFVYWLIQRLAREPGIFAGDPPDSNGKSYFHTAIADYEAVRAVIRPDPIPHLVLNKRERELNGWAPTTGGWAQEVAEAAQNHRAGVTDKQEFVERLFELLKQQATVVANDHIDSAGRVFVARYTDGGVGACIVDRDAMATEEDYKAELWDIARKVGGIPDDGDIMEYSDRKPATFKNELDWIPMLQELQQDAPWNDDGNGNGTSTGGDAA